MCCNKYQHKFDKKLKERFFNTCKFLTTTLISLFYCCKKVFIPMDDWKKINKTSLPEKEDFYSHLNMEDITDADYAHAKRVSKDF